MEKVVITREQADKIKGWEYHTGYPGRLLELHAQYLLTSSKCLQSLSLDELARCLYSEEGYEVEEKFKQHELVIVRQAERVEELEKNCSHLRKSFQRQRNKAVECWEKVIELEREKEDYERALEFYEDKGNYKTVIENDKEIIFLGTSLAQMDGGEVARKVLESSRNEGDSDD